MEIEKNLKLKVSYGYFVYCHHALYEGTTYYGVFESEEKAEEKAKEIADKEKRYDYVSVLFLPYVEFNEDVFALWDETACLGKETIINVTD